jgi:putative DNA primase/helicase
MDGLDPPSEAKLGSGGALYEDSCQEDSATADTVKLNDAAVTDWVATKHFSGNLIHASGVGWLGWDGRYWKPIPAGGEATVRELVKGICVEQHEHAERVAQSIADEAMKKFYKKRADLWNTRCNLPPISNVEVMARKHPLLAVDAEELDADDNLFNLQDYTLDLDAAGSVGRVHPHSSDDKITKMSRGRHLVDWHGSEWDKFLTNIQPDPEVRDYLQQMMGLAMHGKTFAQKFFVLQGPGGRGKSIFLEALRHAFGDYGVNAESELLVRKLTQLHKTYTYALRGKRFVFFEETDRTDPMDASKVKAWTSGGSVSAGKMRSDPSEFKLKATMVLASQYIPRFHGGDTGIERRLVVIEFDTEVPEYVGRSDIADKFREQGEIDAIMSWCYGGWLKCLELDPKSPQLPECEAIRNATEEVTREADPLRVWLEERCEIVDQNALLQKDFPTSSDLWKNYNQWREARGHQRVSQTSFSTDLASRQKSLKIEKKHLSSGFVFSGLVLKESPVGIDNSVY